jgi:PAS domain S-box-containing protein
MDLSQYRLETLHQDGEFILYRGLRHTKAETSPPSILALSPVMERPAAATIKKIQHEFSLKDELNPAWAIRPIALTQQQSRTMLVFEDPNGEPLDRLLPRPMELKQFLRCAIGIAAALGPVHRRGLVHKDIKPSNVLANAAVDQAWLMGFGIASRLPRERQRPELPEFISGTLAYMAPEQTGRMNRSIDSRSDLYALGITLYELLTGSLPFTASDPMEWIHCHIARQPLPPADRLRDIPRSVSAIIMKLLAKTPEQRYQTAAGLETDLRRCLEDWDREGGVHDFALGKHDRSNRLQIPEKLYGREREIETLLASFDRVVKTGTPEWVLVSGHSGIGKSSVVNELHKVLVPPRGLFASGKFDQYKRDIPYAGLAQAFQSLIRRLLSKPEIELNTWRDDFRQALGPNGALVVELIPELKFIIGEQPAVPELSLPDAKIRFQLTLRRLIGVFARAEHPLALFLDDLQWLDAATLDLLEDVLVQRDLHYLLLIGAYRNTEVDRSHPLMRKLAGIREEGAAVQEIVLAPLNQEDLAHLIAETVHCEPHRAIPLAELVHQKTAGNPFFANQFIQELVEEGSITFDPGHAKWLWDLGPMHAKGYTDNVVDLIVGKLSRLPLTTQEALKDLACLGNRAETSTLSVVRGTSEEEVHSDLWEARRSELIVRSQDSYRFVHDRVQEAAYLLMPERLRPEAHLRIGRLLLAHTPPGEREAAIFEIVSQLNRGAALISSREEREQLAELSLIVGKRAKAAGAYASALNYLIAGVALVSKDGWERRHELIFELELHRAECEFLRGEMASAEEHLRMLSSRAADAVQRAAVACLVADVYWALQRPERGLEDCLECLRHAGLDIPIHPTEAQAQTAYGQICSRLDGVRIDELAERPLMTDPTSRAVLNVLAKVLPSAVTVDKNLVSLIVCAAVDISLERGHCDSSCFAYEYLGFIAAWNFGDFEAGFRFGLLGHELVERKGLRKFEGFVSLILSSCLMPWARHIASCRELVRTTFDVANKIGDRHSAVSSRGELVSNLLFGGEPLVEAEKEAEVGLEFCRRAAFSDYIDRANILAAFIRNLRGLTRPFGSLDDERFDELRVRDHWATQPHLLASEYWYWVRRLQARFFAGDYAAALDASIRAQGLLSEAPGALELVEYELYSAHTHAAVCDFASPDERRRHIDAVAAHLRQLELWARHCPENFENRAALVGAEIARIEGRDLDAMRLYEKAIRSSRTNGFVHNEALAYERASAFYRARGFDQFADTYLRNARACYLSWGADGKVRQLDQMYPQLSSKEPALDSRPTIDTSIEHLDLTTVLKVSQAVSGEIVLGKLIDTLLRMAIEHAGAERGLLVLLQGTELRVQAEAVTAGCSITISLRDTPITSDQLPEAVVEYAARTQESVILEDASARGNFSNDEYIRKKHARSILCLPLVKQGRLSAVLYLENNLAANVFTAGRIAVLNVLASAAAISVENSRLYHDLQEREAKIGRLVDANIVGIFIWNLEGRILEANDAFLRIVGYDRDDLVAGCLRWTDLTPPEWLDRDTQQWVPKLKMTGSLQPFEKEYFRKDGSRVPVLIGVATFDETGNQGVAFVLDLTERKRAEDSLRAAMAERARLDAVRAEVGTALARRDSLKGILHTCAEAIVHHLDAVFARIWTLTSDGLQLELQASAGMYTRLDGRYSRIPFGRFKIGLIAQERKAHLTNDVRHDPRIDNKGWAMAEGIISFAGYPLVVEGRIVGVMGMFSREALGKSTVDTLAFIADGIAQGIERKKAEEKLRRSEKQLRDVIETMPAMAFTVLPDGSTEFVNRRFSEYTGLKAEELGLHRRNTVHPEDREGHINKWQASLASGEPFENEVRHRGADGQYRWFLVRGVPLRNEHGTILKWFGTLTDIEDRKQTEERLRNENVVLREEIVNTSMFEEIVGTSAALQGVLARVAKVAPTDSTVLITGDTGTGKELIARAIHKRSRRSGRAFVSVNCAALAPSLISSELFGHEKGAFTGATQRRLGRFELADGGTIFLDEVGELPPEVQVALLRVLQEREFERVGGAQPIHVDVRVIAATNRDLKGATADRTMRLDLFYRLNVFPIEVPPLRERKDDILILLEYFVKRYARRAGKNIRSIAGKTLELFQSYDWPGNIRELQNVVERSVILTSGDVFSVDESWFSRESSQASPRIQASPSFGNEQREEREIIEAALTESRGRVAGPAGAAARLGIPPSTLEYKIKTLKIRKSQFKFG